MRDRYSKKVGAFLQAETKNLSHLFAKVKELQELQASISKYLEPNIANFCQVANRVGNRLVIIAANGSIATQVRFQSVDLLRKFKQEPLLAAIQEIQCKVFPYEQTRLQRAPARKTQLLSTESAETIRAIAETITDPKLKSILEKLAGNVEL